jgi:cytochrome c biogenesis protein
MRFAIALLTLICIASVIGTVVKQGEPMVNYVNQFGPFWAEVFGAARAVRGLQRGLVPGDPGLPGDLHQPVHRAQHTQDPGRPAQLQGAGARAGAARPSTTRRPGTTALSPTWLSKVLQTAASARAGRRAPRGEARGDGGRPQGQANKIGYLAAHSAIVLVCLGGLFDGDLVVRAQMALQGKSTYSGGGLIKRRAGQHRLSERNPTFRGNLLVPEGASAPAWRS